MLYPNLKFPKITTRPFFYTNFVQTVDGKVHVRKPGYWPIGSKTDQNVLIELRAYADLLIHGKNLAKKFGSITKNGLQKKSFKTLRRKLGKNPALPYYVVSNRSQSLLKLAKDLYKKGYKHVLLEGGPTLLGSFLKEGLIDEIFLTIAPRIYGSKEAYTLSLVEGILFPKKATKILKLLFVKQIGDELFLRYKIV